jgi:hypothetical protein
MLNVPNMEGTRPQGMRRPPNQPAVIPAQAGIQCGWTKGACDELTKTAWIPACAHCCPGKKFGEKEKLLQALAERDISPSANSTTKPATCSG